MKESQIIEFKETWRDEYLKWICGFANAEGGVLIIGKNDRGEAVGVANAAKLMEDLPNKIRDVLGVMADVRLVRTAGKEIVEIHVEPYLSPISYKGEFHYRTGSTKQELKGAALESFLLRKHGRDWDGVPVPYAVMDDLDANAFKQFKRAAAKSGRMDEAILQDTHKRILENLNLCEGAYLRRAAVLLFHENPERFVPGAYVKIGFFRNHADLAYQDEIHGNLFDQARKILDLLLTKYMKAYIHYEGITRVERFLFPPEALRELILNALVHRDYGSGVPIQIRVYDDQLRIWNNGCIPEGWTVEDLLGSHISRPHNPLIASAFFRTGDIESWGRGIEKVRNACIEYGTDFPTFQFMPDGLLVMFKGRIPAEDIAQKISENAGENAGEYYPRTIQEQETTQETTQDTTQEQETTQETTPDTTQEQETTQEKIIRLMKSEPFITRRELAERIGLSDDGVKYHLDRLRKMKCIRHAGSTKRGHWEVIGNGKMERGE